ncbi:TVG0651504 [Thermoplasma volcanium GSS1]|uniref:TVG0651504 protein n=1 Tax=Thermoplasma volcanium (strain ATCC 51530 / DSM 4299 / JCM 9571 / NBRC 15438 / GSS1) TaxID=273116 RepID=Q97B03_THEVO|nr:cell division GTPase [Thermoplasma volcanium]BAB59798.1 TVG0651504 [Thermoplasma volcanium GSS1]
MRLIQRRSVFREERYIDPPTVAHEYYSCRTNVVVVSFGNAGFRILRKMNPIDIRNVESYAVFRGTPARNSYYNGSLNVKGREISFEVYSIENIKNPFLKYSANPIKIMDGLTEEDALYAAQKLKSTGISFVLVSGFGGSFAQYAHSKFLEILNKSGREALSIIVVPSSKEGNRREKAISAINDLRATGNNIVVFDNDKFSFGYNFQNIMEKIEKANTMIANRLDEYISEISLSIDRLKYAIISG